VTAAGAAVGTDASGRAKALFKRAAAIIAITVAGGAWVIASVPREVFSVRVDFANAPIVQFLTKLRA
jgi:hypothetical protein